jgi:hypothetical protein
MPPYWFQNLGGGRDGGLHPASIRDNQLADILNFYPIGSKLKRRGGCLGAREWAWPNEIAHSGFLYRSSLVGAVTNQFYIGTMVAGVPRIWTYLAGAPIASTLPAPSPNSIFKPWFFANFGGVLYTIHPGFPHLARTIGASHDVAGIPAPAAACVLADGGAGTGAFAAGTYYDVYTYYNTVTGIESNPSPASNGVVLAAGRRINAANITVSPTAQVNARRLYRTFANQQGQYYFVTQISDNVTTVYNNEEVAPIALGRAVRFDNGDIHTIAGAPGVGTGQFTGMTVWGSRLWLTDGRYVYYSNLGKPESYDTEQNFFPVFSDDGEPILGIYAYGDRLVVMKYSRLYYITGSGPGSFGTYVLSDRHGCPAPHSMKSVGSRLFWFDGTNFCTTEGGAVRTVGETAVRDRLASLTDATTQYVYGLIVPDRHQYHAVVPTSALTYYTDGVNGCQVPKFTSEILVYDYVADAWVRYDHPSVGNAISLFPSDDNPDGPADGYMGVFNNDTRSALVFYDRPNQLKDYTNNEITASIITKAVVGGITAVLRRVLLMLPPYAGRTITLAAYDDGNAGYTTAIKTRAGLSIADRDAIKAFNLSTAGRLSRLLQVKMTYTGADAIELSGIGLEVDEHQRLVRQPR